MSTSDSENSDAPLDTLIRDFYRVRVDATQNPRVELVPGAEYRVKLTVGLRDHVSLTRALVRPPRGGMVALDMTFETAKEVYLQIADFAHDAGYRLPDTSVRRAEFPRGVQTDLRAPGDRRKR
jgi:hypothetical protein